jgi:hypothetical protein
MIIPNVTYIHVFVLWEGCLVMRKKTFLVFYVLIACTVILMGVYVFNISGQNDSAMEAHPASDSASAAEPNIGGLESAEFQSMGNVIDQLKAQVYMNPGYEMFYGEWAATSRVYVDPSPLRGIYYTEEEREAIAEGIFSEGLETKTIQYTRENIVINEDTVIDNIKYICRIFPADDSYRIGWNLSSSMEEIGLTEGNYFVFVEVNSEADRSFEGHKFLIKDKNTLIVYRDSYYIEYARTSYEGGSEEPALIIG